MNLLFASELLAIIMSTVGFSVGIIILLLGYKALKGGAVQLIIPSIGFLFISLGQLLDAINYSIALWCFWVTGNLISLNPFSSQLVPIWTFASISYSMGYILILVGYMVQRKIISRPLIILFPLIGINLNAISAIILIIILVFSLSTGMITLRRGIPYLILSSSHALIFIALMTYNPILLASGILLKPIGIIVFLLLIWRGAGAKEV
ncbi:MAG: hypothetical protein J7K59_00350 [Candidatus Korarchaeota archaeon]|nr:hypothetical protein [Candidatus Korarchaeota archaeon]